MEVEVLADADAAAARRAAEAIAAAGAEAAGERGAFSLAVSGGRSPWAMLALLAGSEEMPWDATQVFQVDERVAEPGSDERNLTHLLLALPMERHAAVRPMPVTSPTWRPRRRSTRRGCPSRSTSSTSASAPTDTPPRWSPVTRCWR